MTVLQEEIETVEEKESSARVIEPPVRIRNAQTRRAFLLKAAAGAAASTGAVAVAQKFTPHRSTASVSAATPRIPGLFHTPALDVADRWGTPEIRLARRITQGLSPDEITLARARGFSGYLDYHLAPEAIDDTRVDAFVASTYPELAMDGTQLFSLNATTLQQRLQEGTVFRAAFSKRQLFERMVEFWSDHFNISIRKVGYLKLIDDREVIRKNALGKFPDLLRASAHSAAMLAYLDNNLSRYPRVNQNYARELMELHTLGVDGGYTQNDVAEVARCLSGWTITNRGGFSFDPTGHDYGAKSFLGQTIPAAPGTGAAGVNDGEAVLTFLISHPSTAKFVSTKMIHWLLRYDPPASLVTTVANVYSSTGGDIKAMIRAILTPENVISAPVKHKRPFHLVASALRALNPTVTRLNAVTQTWLTNLGQEPFFWETPDGYPDHVEYWAGSIMSRWNFGDYITALASGEVVVDVTPFRTTDTADGITASIDNMIFAGAMPASTRTRVRSYLAASTITTQRVREALALTLNSGSFQWY